MKVFKALKNLIVLTVAVCAVPLAGCKSPDLESVIPDTFGSPEGLYLYKGNYRSLTDGSEKERILKEATLGGEVLGSESFYVTDCVYATAAHKIFYCLETDGGKYFYRYDYKEKSGEELYFSEDFTLFRSDEYVYVKDDAAESGYLYSLANGGFAAEIYGEFMDIAVVAEVKTYDDFGRQYRVNWFYNGAYGTSEYSDYSFDFSKMFIGGDCFYFFGGNPVRVINTADGSINNAEFVGFDADNIRVVTGRGGTPYYAYPTEYGFFVLAMHYETVGGDKQRICEIFSFDGARGVSVYTLGNIDYGIEISKVDGVFYFEMGTAMKTRLAKFDPKTGKGSTVSSIPGETQEQKFTIDVGGYTFYVDYKLYNEYKFAGYLPIPIPTNNKCWFMYRVSGKKTEIMQYSLSSNKFYDDIREF